MTTTVPTRDHVLVADLRTTLTGDVIDPADARYDEARRVWNGLIDRRPAVIARCTTRADVVAALAAAGTHRPPVSIRGGGHQIAGSAVCDDGLVIDLSDDERRDRRPVDAAPPASGPAPAGPTSTPPPSSTVSSCPAARSPRPASPG